MKFKYEKYIMSLHKDEAKVMERRAFLKCHFHRFKPKCYDTALPVTEHKYGLQIRSRKSLHVFFLLFGSLTLVHKFPGNSAQIHIVTGATHCWFCRFFQLQGFRSLISPTPSLRNYNRSGWSICIQNKQSVILKCNLG